MWLLVYSTTVTVTITNGHLLDLWFKKVFFKGVQKQGLDINNTELIEGLRRTGGPDENLA